MSIKLGDDVLPAYTHSTPPPAPRRRSKVLRLLALALGAYVLLQLPPTRWPWSSQPVYRPANADDILAQCRSLSLVPGPPPGFADRTESDRFEPDTPPTLITNSTIWLGEGRVIENAELYMDGGIIKAIAYVPKELYENVPGVVVVDAQGAWVTPGIVDLHSHIGVDPLPALQGALDGNSFLGAVQPWLRSIDGLNTHDQTYETSIAGGVTSALVLPGSADNIGGQAFMIKLRPTKEKSSSAMVLEPPYGLWNGTNVSPDAPPRWRHIKHACGENPIRIFHQTRMDNVWRFRQAYAAAAKVRDAQDAFCESALAGDWSRIAGETFPEDLALEALVDVLRGKVKVNVHCYEAVDFDGFVRLTNEFKFPVAAFHHAHEAYLVPDLIKKTWGGIPAIAQFATFARYKREAYRGSEFAPKILADAGIPVIMKSDHPYPINSRFLLYEAQQAYLYGLNASLALASVTSTSAAAAGFAHRLGHLKVGHDADVVIWDSHPLQLGAAALQVYIDGIAQLSYDSQATVENGFIHAALKDKQTTDLQTEPPTSSYEQEAKMAVEHDGEPPLSAEKTLGGAVLFTNVSSIWNKDASNDLSELLLDTKLSREKEVLVKSGKIICTGQCAHLGPTDEVIDLNGGSLAPGLTTVGSYLGLVAIKFEASTGDGAMNPVASGGGVNGNQPLRAVDGVQFGGKDMLLAYRSGVTTAITSPVVNTLSSGLSVTLRTGAWNKAEKGSVIKPVTAVHISTGHAVGLPSVSAQIAWLRRALSGAKEGDVWWDVANGSLPLFVAVENADVMSTLILLKREIEIQFSSSIEMSFFGAAEAWMVAENIAEENIGVIVAPSRMTPIAWDQRRTLPGPPLTEDSNISHLLAHNVTVGLGVTWEWQVRNTRFDAIWAYREAHGRMSKKQALQIVSSNLNKLLGLNGADEVHDLVAYKGGDFFDPGAKAVGIVSEVRGTVEIL